MSSLRDEFGKPRRFEVRDASFPTVDELRPACRGLVTTETRRIAEAGAGYTDGVLGVVRTGEPLGFEEPKQVELATIAISKHLAMLTEADRLKVRSALAYTGGDRGGSRTSQVGVTSNDQHDALTCAQADRIEEIQKMNDDFWKNRLAV